jgi:hypothetical protein
VKPGQKGCIAWFLGPLLKALNPFYLPFILHSSSIHPPLIFHNIMEDEWKNNGSLMDKQWIFTVST